MGKKSLEEIGKIILISFIAYLLTSITVRRALLDGKVDKAEFNAYTEKHEREHEKEAKIDAEFREIILDEVKGTREDIRELIRIQNNGRR